MSDVKCEKKGMKIPTYIPKKAHELPMFFENKPYQGASGRVYPIPYCDGISDEKTDVEYETYTLEIDYVKTQVVPALGGKILRGFNFAAGEMVQHKAFGRGMILTVLPMGNDALLEIAFDGVGTKRLMANTASQHMKKL